MTIWAVPKNVENKIGIHPQTLIRTFKPIINHDKQQMSNAHQKSNNACRIVLQYFPYSHKISKGPYRALGFLVSCFCWFPDYSVSWLFGFLLVLISWFQRFLISKFPKSMIPYYKNPFHVFRKLGYWSRIQGFQEFIRRIGAICRRLSFPKIDNI